MFKSQLIFENLPKAPSCHASSLIELPNGLLKVAFFAGEYEKAQDVAIWGSNLNLMDSDAKWSAPKILSKAPDQSMGSPVWYITPDNRLYLFFLVMHHGKILPAGWSVCTIQYQTSDDFGESWSERKFLRKNWFWVNRAIIIKTDANTVVFPMHREAFTMQSMMYINDKLDLTGKWKRYGRIKVPGGCLEPSVTKLSNGELLCAMRTQIKKIYFSRSKDHGKTWSKAVETPFPNPDSQCVVHCLKSGRLILVYNHTETGRSPLSVVSSTDGGLTWSDHKNIEDKQGSEFSYPCVVQTSDGLIHLSYTHFRKQIKHAVFDEKWLTE